MLDRHESYEVLLALKAPKPETLATQVEDASVQPLTDVQSKAAGQSEVGSLVSGGCSRQEGTAERVQAWKAASILSRGSIGVSYCHRAF
jgi:hypothetical protein